MSTLSLLFLACLAATATAGVAPGDVTLASLQQSAQDLANPVVAVIEAVNEAVPAYLEAARRLHTAADVMNDLLERRNELSDLKRQAKSLTGTDQDERSTAVARIQDLLAAVQTTRNRVNIAEYRTRNDGLEPIEAAVGILEAQAAVIADGSAPTETEYYAETTPMNRADARENCQQRGMDLVSITSAEVQQTLDELYITSGMENYYWTSGILVNNQFVWEALDNLPVNDGYTNWRQAQPNSGAPGPIVGSCGGVEYGWCDVNTVTITRPSMCQSYPA